MSGPEMVKAWHDWRDSAEGRGASDPTTTEQQPEFRSYMESRLFRAFSAGVKAAEEAAVNTVAKRFRELIT